MKNFLLVPMVVILLIAGCTHKRSEQSKPYVVMLSMDGFRWDYTDHVSTPNFDKIAMKGVKAQSLKPSFPTKTFPNHYSIATGLYPDHHGIVLNTFYDPATDREYSISNREAVEDGSFYGGEPIWVTAEKQGMISSSYFWVGSEAEIAGHRPTYWKKYDHDFPYGQRVDSVIAWLQKPEEIRPHLILWYLDEPDHSGHKFGPESIEIRNKVAELDSILGVFLTKVEALPNADEINIIITSDHGMGSISNDRRVNIGDLLQADWADKMLGYNPNFNIKSKPEHAGDIYEALKDKQGLKVWYSDSLPERLHYGTNLRCLDFVVLADSSWSLVPDSSKRVGNGAHGFDNANSDMHAIFYAYGPAFKVNYVSPTFENVDIYPLICEILGLEPAPVDGKLEHVKGLRK